MNYRLDGTLAVTRSMGDFGYNGMTCEPYVERTIVESGDYLVIASDGIFDVIEDPMLVKYINKNHKERPCSEIVKQICNDAVDFGSEDNISCIVLRIA